MVQEISIETLFIGRKRKVRQMTKKYVENYDKHQYEDEVEKGIFKGTYKARYIKQEEPTYQDNILIEALPPVKDMAEVFDLMDNRPLYSEKEREKEQSDRIHAVFRLDQYLFPFPVHFAIEQDIAIAIRTGYVNKTVLSPDHIKKLRELSNIINSSKSEIKNYSEMCVGTINENQTANGFSLLGISGGGKTTAVNKILSSYPQHIVHTAADDDVFLFHQLTWLKLDCAHNGSIKGLCQKFFYNVDLVLGTDYSKKYGLTRNSVEYMIIAIAHIALKHGLGVLVVDEIQHLRTLKNGASETALNFFVTLMNEIKLPIVYIGTYKAIEALSGDFRQVRRVVGMGLIEMSFLERDDFDMLIEDLWSFQWIKNKCELTDSLKNTMYECTAGIPDIVKKLFIAVQVEAIRSESETITEELIRKMLKEKFPYVKNMIDKIKTGRINEIYDDLKSPDLFNKFIENSVQEVRNKEKAREVINSKERKAMIDEISIINELCLFMEEVGFGYSKVEKIAKKIVKKFGNDKELSFLKNELIKEVYKEKLKENPSTKPNIKTINNTKKKEKQNKELDKKTEEFLKENIKAANE